MDDQRMNLHLVDDIAGDDNFSVDYPLFVETPRRGIKPGGASLHKIHSSPILTHNGGGGRGFPFDFLGNAVYIIQ
jgi:hypothetical protein